MDLLETPQGSFRLERLGTSTRSPLRAWDAADELVLDHLGNDVGPTATVVICNDGSGAIATALSRPCRIVWSDSVMAEQSARWNLGTNRRDLHRVGFVGTAEELGAALDAPGGEIDVAVVKIPKGADLLDYQLRSIAPLLSPGAQVVGAGMTRHVHRSTIALFERHLGSVTTSLARKKARLLFVEPDPQRRAEGAGRSLTPGRTASPAAVTERFSTEEGVTVHGAPGVFGSRRLDAGTRLLLDALLDTNALLDPDALLSTNERGRLDGEGRRALDLGAGTGVVGATIGRRHPRTALSYVDVSRLAIAAAQATHTANHPDRPANFALAGDLAAYPDRHFDLIAVNPPFHDAHAVGDQIIWQMLRDARRTLAAEGRLVVVANRHLGLHRKLASLFDRSQQIGGTAKYVVFEASSGP